MSFSKETWTIVSGCRNDIKRPDSIVNTKQWYRSKIYFIKKHEQPWTENRNYHFVCVSHVFFQDFTTILDFYHNIVLRMWRLQ